MKKPDPRIFHLLSERFQIPLDNAVFIDDSQANIDAARGLGMKALHFTAGGNLRSELEGLGLL